MNKNIFRDTLDGIIYFVLYLIVPLAQIIANIVVAPALFWFSALIATASLAYDAYTRFSHKSSRGKRKKIIWIGVVSFGLLLYTIGVLIFRSQDGVPCSQMFWPFLLLVVPFIIALHDTWEMFNKAVS